MSAEIKTLHVPFRQWLDTEMKGRVAYSYHRPDQPTGATKGDADFIIYAENRCLHIEFKDKDTKVSVGQVERHNELRAVGVTVHIVRSLEAAVELVTEWKSMIGVSAPKPPPGTGDNLRRWANGVFRVYQNGAHDFVRPVGPGDENIKLLGAK